MDVAIAENLTFMSFKIKKYTLENLNKSWWLSDFQNGGLFLVFDSILICRLSKDKVLSNSSLIEKNQLMGI